jgi:uncharacterized protein (DUF58 family)
VIPTQRLALAVAAVAVVFLGLGTILGTVAIALLAAGFIADVLALNKVPEVERNVPTTMERLRPAPLSVTATDTRAGSIVVRQTSVPDLKVAQQIGTDALSTTVRAVRRGRHSLPPITVRSTGPFGLAARQREIGDSHHVAVYPDVTGAMRIARAVANGSFSSSGLRRRGPIGIGTEFESVRDYTPDDDIRHVNWRATMRTGRPMTNSYRIDRDRDVVCVVDSGRLMTAPIGAHSRLDVAVDATAAIAHTADAIGDRCGVVAFDSQVKRSLPPLRRGAHAVVEAVHDLEPVAVESDYELAFRAVSRTKRSLVVLFTDLFEEAAALPLLEALPILSRRHAVIVAYVRDEDLRAAVTDPASDGEAPYRTVVALDALEARRAVVARLRHRGITVIEAAAADLPAAAVDAYLRLKQRSVI